MGPRLGGGGFHLLRRLIGDWTDPNPGLTLGLQSPWEDSNATDAAGAHARLVSRNVSGGPHIPSTYSKLLRLSSQGPPLGKGPTGIAFGRSLCQSKGAVHLEEDQKETRM